MPPSKLDPGQVIQKFVKSPESFVTGAVLVIDTPFAVTPNDVPFNVGVALKANPANTSAVYVLASEEHTAADGWLLEAGNEIFIPIDNLNKLVLVADVYGQDVRYIGS